jgi:CBS domain-containing protein
MSIQAGRPRDELLIALAGPAVSLTVAGVTLGLALVVDVTGSSPGLLGGGLIVVGGLNLMLAVLSLLPGMPLDGGRIVRAVAWAATGDRGRAGRVTVTVGRVIGWALVGAGAAAAIADTITIGMLMLALGWILATGAGTLAGRARLERLLKGATVADAMVDDVPRIAPGLTVDTFADRFSGEERVSCLPVTDGDAVLGVIGARAVRRLSRGRLATARAADIMQAPPTAPFLAPTDELWSAVEVMNRLAVEGLAVVEDGLLVGVVMRESIGRLLARRGAQPTAAAGLSAR